jgi:hypothetical protein
MALKLLKTNKPGKNPLIRGDVLMRSGFRENSKTSRDAVREKLMKLVPVRFTESDIAEITIRAKAKNLTVSGYVRRMVLAAKAMTEGEEILLAEIMRNRELLMRLGDTDAGARAARQDIQEQVELVPPEALVGRAMSLRCRAQRKAG